MGIISICKIKSSILTLIFTFTFILILNLVFKISRNETIFAKKRKNYLFQASWKCVKSFIWVEAYTFIRKHSFLHILCHYEKINKSRQHLLLRNIQKTKTPKKMPTKSLNIAYYLNNKRWRKTTEINAYFYEKFKRKSQFPTSLKIRGFAKCHFCYFLEELLSTEKGI